MWEWKEREGREGRGERGDKSSVRGVAPPTCTPPGDIEALITSRSKHHVEETHAANDNSKGRM